MNNPFDPSAFAARPGDLTPAGANRTAGLARLRAFLPNAGKAYEAARNVDAAPERKGAVSLLSPWIRHRLITEAEVLHEIDRCPGFEQARKFVDEVLWRAYWKGWLESRPGTWDAYCAGLTEKLRTLDKDAGLRNRFELACGGKTGIACFDAWVEELRTFGYLHNHARMWFASIWIFTLGLPWELGADFFLRHLIDGDAASNTLSWRWVAGLHTPGKHYVARAKNIYLNTNCRFNPIGQLNETPAALAYEPHPPLRTLPDVPAPPGGKSFLLLHEDDFGLESLNLPETISLTGIGLSTSPGDRSPLPCAAPVEDWIGAAAEDTCRRARERFGLRARMADEEEIAEAAVESGAKFVITPYSPCGWTAQRLSRIQTRLAKAGLRLYQIRRQYDDKLWPCATAGFFRFRDAALQNIRLLQQGEIFGLVMETT